jgi:polygalacturonase
VSRTEWDVREFGASGDGRALDTDALQAAIDACSSAGGGRVVVPAGRYLTGTVYLKSDVELHLRAGARLVGSADRADYNPDDAVPEDPPITIENATGAHLIIAYRQRNVAITGHGVIDGNSGAFFGPAPADAAPEGYRYKAANQPVLTWRPGQMVFFFGCERVTVTDVALVDSPYWTLYVFGCRDVRVSGITIDNPPTTQNGDGIDVVSCRDVRISDCLIRSGDDSLVLRTRPIDDDSLPVTGPICENVTVTNCILSSPCNAIRIGVADGTVRRCVLSNIVIDNSRTGINMICRYSDRVASGTCIEDVHFADVVMDVCLPVVVGVGEGAERPAAIRDVSFSRFHIRASAGAQVAGSSQVPVERVRFDDIDWTVVGGTENLELVDAVPPQLARHGYHGKAGRPALPYALYGTGLADAEFHRLRFRWERPSPVWRSGLHVVESVRTREGGVSGHTPVRGETD